MNNLQVNNTTNVYYHCLTPKIKATFSQGVIQKINVRDLCHNRIIAVFTVGFYSIPSYDFYGNFTDNVKALAHRLLYTLLNVL